MGVLKIVFTILLVIAEVFLIAVVLLQSGKSAGLSGALGGESSDTFFGKNKGKTFEGKLEKWTKISAVLFLVIAVVLALIS